MFTESIKCLEQRCKVWKLAESNEVLDWNKIPLARIQDSTPFKNRWLLYATH